MAAENQNGGRSPSDNSTKVDRSLDDLARDLATSNVSRGRALKTQRVKRILQHAS
jgi:hypothetical protein